MMNVHDEISKTRRASLHTLQLALELSMIEENVQHALRHSTYIVAHLI